MITIDGAFGEGGGQIIRTSLALSLVTGKPFTIERIRALRKKSGLLRQHLTAVNAARDVSDAEVVGNQLGSTSLRFAPGTIRAGSYQFDIGSAGSTTLVLQTVLPALMGADDPSQVTLTGGTHNPMAPPFDFLQQAYVSLLSRMGPSVTMELERPGFYPAGGGLLRAGIVPSSELTRLELSERGNVVAQSARALVANLPKSIAQREIDVVRRALRLRKSASKAVELDGARSPGNVLFVTVECEHVTELFTGFGERGVRAEVVAEKTVKRVQEYLGSGAAVGPHLADQLLIPLALAGGGRFSTMAPSSHMTTNIQVIKKFLDVKIEVEELEGRQYLCTVS